MNTHAPRKTAVFGLLIAMAASGGHLRSQQTNASAPADVVRLDPFTVDSSSDEGYRANESVSGSRFVTELKNFPFSLEVLPANFLEDINAVKLEDSLAYATGTLAFENNLNDDIFIYQRGFRTDLHLRDGVRKPGLFDSQGAERIEVVKGPSSVLFGITNPGGTVNYISKKPLARPEAKFGLTVGSWGTLRSTIDIGGPVGTSKSVRYRLPASFRRSDGYFVNSESDSAYAAPVVSWQATKSTKVEMGVEYQKTHTQPMALLPGVINVPVPYYTMFLPRDWNSTTDVMFLDSWAIQPTATVTHSFNDTWKMRASASLFRTSMVKYASSRGATTQPAFLVPRQAQRNLLDTSEHFQSNIDIVGSFSVAGGVLTAIGGFEYQDNFDRLIATTGFGVGAKSPAPWSLLDPTTWHRDNDADNVLLLAADNSNDREATAFSALMQYSSNGERLHLSGGLRNDSIDGVFNDYRRNILNSRSSDRKTTMQAGVLYRASDSISVYANYSSSFQPIAGTLIDKDMNSFAPVPVTGEGVEIGLRQEFKKGRFVHSLALFQIDQENLVERLLGTSNLNVSFAYNAQGGLHRSKGLEYTFNGMLNDRIALFGGYSYNDARVIKNRNGADIGQRLTFAYRYKANVFVRYEFQAERAKGAYLGVGYVVVGDAPAQNGTLNLLTYPAYETAQFVLGRRWKWGDYEYDAQLNVKNAFSGDYVTYNSYRSEPRRIDLTVRVGF